MINGVNQTGAILMPKANVDRNFKDIAAIGFTHVRCEMVWAKVEPTKGRYNWVETDMVMNLAEKHGLKVLWIVGVHEPKWGFFGLIDTTTVADYQRLCVAANQRYGKNELVAGWEIWNEPNSAGYFGKKNWLGQKTTVDPKGYVDYLTLGEKAFEESDAQVLLGGIMACPTNPYAANVLSPEDWIDALHKNQGSGIAHAVSFHPYGYKWDTGANSIQQAPQADSRYMKSIKTLSDKASGYNDYRIHATEWGFDWMLPGAQQNAVAWICSQWEMLVSNESPVFYGRYVQSHYFYNWQDEGGFTYGAYDANYKARPNVVAGLEACLSVEF